MGVSHQHSTVGSFLKLLNFCNVAFAIIVIFLITSCQSNKIKEKSDDKQGLKTLADACKLRDSYDSAISFYQQYRDINFKSSTWNEWIAAVNGIIDCYRLKGEYELAFKEWSHTDSLALRRMSSRSKSYVEFLQRKAILLSETRNFEESNKIFNTTLEIRKDLSIPRDTTLALIYNGIGTNYLYLISYDTAYRYYLAAINNYDTLKLKNTADYAMFNLNAGIIKAIQGDYNFAQKYFDISLSISESILKANDPKLGLAYLNVGRFFSLTGNDEKALELLTKSENIFKLKDRKSGKLASLYLNIGSIYVNKANYEKALSYYNNALALIQSDPNGSQSDLLTVFLNLGFIYEKKEDYPAAKKFYLAGLQKGEKYPNSVKVLRGLANVDWLLNLNAEAETYYSRALNKSIELFGPDHPETALTYFKYGEFSSLTGNNQKSLGYLEKGLNIYQKAYGEKNRDVGYAYYLIGNYYHRNLEYLKALEYFQKSLISGFRNFNDPDIFHNPTADNAELTYYQLNTISAKALAFYDLYKAHRNNIGYLKASADTYTLAIRYMELLKSTYQEEDSKLMIAGNEKNTVLNAISTQVALYTKAADPDALEKAFDYSEKGKSSVLMSYLRDTEAKNIGKIPDDVRKLDNRLKQDISFYNKLIFDETSKKDANQSKINFWNNTVFDLSRQHDSLIALIEKQYPDYYKLKYDNSVISLAQTRKKIENNQAILEYTLADSALYLFVITKNENKLFVTPLKRVFYSDIAVLRDLLTGKSFNNYSPEDLRTFTGASYRLYKILIEPCSNLILNKNLIIVPDAELGYLSFDILLTKPAGAKVKGYRSLPYLIKEYAISYAPSVTTLYEGLKSTAENKNHMVLAFAPTYGGLQKDKSDEILRKSNYPLDLLPIPGAQTEVKQLKHIFRSRIFNGQNATEDNFKKYASNYSILHLAMHTIINDANPLYSKLVFYHSNDSTQDGLLNTSELFGIQLNADLAVLSACNTGTGKLERGEGIMSLSRGFFYAGVPSIIMTSWAVEDNSGSELMTSFYQHLAEGLPKNEALRQAKIDYLEKSDQLKSHPHFWAAYMNIGDIHPLHNLKTPTPIYIHLIWALAGLLLVSVAYFIYKKRLRNPVR